MLYIYIYIYTHVLCKRIGLSLIKTDLNPNHNLLIPFERKSPSTTGNAEAMLTMTSAGKTTPVLIEACRQGEIFWLLAFLQSSRTSHLVFSRSPPMETGAWKPPLCPFALECSMAK